MENIFLTGHKPKNKNKLLEKALDIINNFVESEPKLILAYEKSFNYMDFDTFAKIKELYSSDKYKFIPKWDNYFTCNKIKAFMNPNNKDPIRLFFMNIKSGISQRDNHLIEEVDGKRFEEKNKDLIRKPFYITLNDIDYASYYKLLRYLLVKFYSSDSRFNATKLSITGQRESLETNRSFIVTEYGVLRSITDCIKQGNEDGLKYLIETIGLKPNLKQMEMIDTVFSEEVYDFISYYFE